MPNMPTKLPDVKPTPIDTSPLLPGPEPPLAGWAEVQEVVPTELDQDARRQLTLLYRLQDLRSDVSPRLYSI